MHVRMAALAAWRRALLLRDDTRGVSAVEFAMIMPLMFLMFFGMLDVSNGFAVDRKVSQISQGMADLASRYTTLAETDVSNFFIIADAMLTPYDKTQLKATISQVYIDPSSKTAKVVWSRGDQKKDVGTVVSVPTNLIVKDANGNYVANQYLILGEANYTYVPTIGWVVPKGGLTLSDAMYTRPRQTSCVVMVTSCTP
ncbi:TadE/TadG family type IV pilus assembly protein [Tardiphaga sp. 20_F10_N6_6]|jgi:Flp pilus assembly protein TadG|uniref:Pilus assembly protein n=2 Tax=Nitrobacteraceae TaxID=41294 RepID=A0A7G6U7Z9_9BRAD|nr:MULTISPECIES: TadE/TadG family type IV pilus assembly protein [Tardiphaga]NUU41600.1 pilus assembly protein [Tardiphaga robiniae]QND75131.1 pilus assembly protein [Tardiphaga robiniae]UFS74004.1 pilus assembly protein [Tardiphaga sp. 37S4]